MSVVYKQIPNMPLAIALAGPEEFEIVQAGTSKRTSIDKVTSLVVTQVAGSPAPPTGPAGGDLAGFYPNPQLRPSGTNGQVMTTVGGVSVWATPAPSGGTVTSVSVVSVNGLAGTVATPTTTPQISLSTTVTGMLKGNGTAILAAIAGTDFVTPGGLPTTLPPSGAAGGDLSGTYPNPTLKASVALTGDPTAPTPAAGDADFSIPTTAWVQGELAAIAPGGATLTGYWNYNSAALVPPPASGRVRLSVAWPPTLSSSIHLYIASTDIDGFTYTWALGPAVSNILVFRSASGGRAQLLVTATSIQSGYIDVTATVQQISGNNVNNSRCQISILANSYSPSGAAGGDLTGTYPNPLIKPSVTNGQLMTTVGGVAVWAAPPSTVPSGAAGGDLSGTYPNPLIKPSVTNGQLMTTVGGVAVWAAPPSTAPSGAAGGDLSGTYPNPLLKPSVTNGQVMTTVGGVSAWATPAASGGTVTSVSVVSANGLAGTVATPTAAAAITLSTTITGLLKGNGTAISAAVAGTDYVAPGAVALTTGAVGYGAAGVLTGVVANLSFDATNKRLGINQSTPTAALDIVGQANTLAFNTTGYSLTGSSAVGCFNITGALNTTGTPDIFAINVTDTSNSGGNAFIIRGGPSGTASLIRTSMAGDTRVAGWVQARLNDALATNGRDYFAYYLGNGSGGNIGLFAGLSNPTFSTFGRYGSIYLDGASPGVPWYNSNGTTGWTMLAPITATGITAPTAPVDGQLWYNSDGSAGGGTLYIRYNDGSTTQWVPASPAATPGSLLQTVSFETGALATGTTLIPVDDTIPQITEGDQYMTLAITRMSAASRLVIEVTIVLATSAAGVGSLSAALFQDSTANALAAWTQTTNGAAHNIPLVFKHIMASGTTGTTTFRVRGGGNVAGTVTFNGAGAARTFGGVMASSIVIQEVA